MMRGATWLISDPAAIQGIVEVHASATNILLGGSWVQVAAPVAEVLAQYDAAMRPRPLGFGAERRP